MDIGADSKVLIQTLARESVKNQKHAVVWKSRTKKSVVVGVLSVVLAIGVQFFVNYFTNELSKESHVDEQGAMVSTSGKVVKTQMDEMKVGSDGRLVSRDGKSNVKTMPTLARVGLSSSLPDKTLMGLDEIVVYSDKGYTLQIKVHGFSRIPVLNSRCGNVVHFYTAWKGKISLDSTDLSFDEATAAEFEKAGFSLAMGGRRLSGGNKLEGFFKALESANASGKWTCADVPLPTIPRTRIVKSTTHWPCTSGRCSSKYGSYLPGVGQAGRDFAKAIASSTAKILGNFALDMYMKTQSTHFVSDRYQVTTEIMPQHPGQELVSVFDAKKQYYQTFQSQSANKTKSHCSKQKEKQQTDTNDEMHFEYVGTNEESGVILRHFRMQRNSNYIRQMAGDDVRATVTDFWDIAESMQPFRVLDGDGTVILMESVRASVSDAEIEEHFGKLLGECSDEDEATDHFPKMRKYVDLDYEDREYYWEQKFGHNDEALQDAAAKGDGFATYLTKTLDPFSTSDDCQQKCKNEIDMVSVEAKQGTLQDCGAHSHLRVAFDCLASARTEGCERSNFYVSHMDDCLVAAEKNPSNATARMLETEEPEPEDSLLMNGTMVVPVRARALSMPLLWESNCMSSYMIPTPHMFPSTVHMDGQTHYTWPICMEAQVTSWKPLRMAETWRLKIDATKKGAAGYKRYKKNKDNKAKFTVRITFTYVQGTLAIAIMLKACAPLDIPIPAVKPPLGARACVAGNVVVNIRPACPGGKKVHVMGSCTFNLTAFIDLWIAEIPLGLIELGISTGVAWTWHGWCWWIRSPEGPTRRRFWDRRRRNARKCTGTAVCDQYVKGWITLKLLIVQTTFDMIWWQKCKRLESTITVLVYRFWWWSQDWFTCYQKMVWQYIM